MSVTDENQVDVTSGPDQIFEATSYVTSDIEGAVKLRLEDDTADFLPMSLPTMLIDAAEKSPNTTALGVKRDGSWVKWTYSDYLKGKKKFQCIFPLTLLILMKIIAISITVPLKIIFFYRCSLC